MDGAQRNPFPYLERHVQNLRNSIRKTKAYHSRHTFMGIGLINPTYLPCTLVPQDVEGLYMKELISIEIF